MCASQGRKILDRFQPNFQQTNQINLLQMQDKDFWKKNSNPFVAKKLQKYCFYIILQNLAVTFLIKNGSQVSLQHVFNRIALKMIVRILYTGWVMDTLC